MGVPSELLVAVIGLMGGVGGGLVAGYKAWASKAGEDRDKYADAFDRGVERTQSRFEQMLAEERKERIASEAAMREILARHHRAFHKMVKLVPPERMAEALEIISELEIIPFTPEP